MKLIQTQEYLLLIDEEAEIKRGDYLLEKESIINVFPDYLTDLEECKKIIAYRKLNEEAKELDLPLLPNPFEGVDIEKLACKKYNIKEGINDYDERYYNSHNVAKAEAFIEGYKAAQTKGQFSLDDMIAFGKKCFYKGFDKSENDDSNCYTAWREENSGLVQSLSAQQLPKEFIPEYEKRPVCRACNKQGYRHCAHPEECGGWIEMDFFKTITNSEGKQELVGNYKY